MQLLVVGSEAYTLSCVPQKCRSSTTLIMCFLMTHGGVSGGTQTSRGKPGAAQEDVDSCKLCPETGCGPFF